MCNALSRHERRAGRERKRASIRQGNCSDKKKLSNLSHAFAPPLSPPLSRSKKQKNRLFETKLEQYDGDDPLEVWLRYAKAAEGNGKRAKKALSPAIDSTVCSRSFFFLPHSLPSLTPLSASSSSACPPIKKNKNKTLTTGPKTKKQLHQVDPGHLQVRRLALPPAAAAREGDPGARPGVPRRRRPRKVQGRRALPARVGAIRKSSFPPLFPREKKKEREWRERKERRRETHRFRPLPSPPPPWSSLSALTRKKKNGLKKKTSSGRPPPGRHRRLLLPRAQRHRLQMRPALRSGRGQGRALAGLAGSRGMVQPRGSQRRRTEAQARGEEGRIPRENGEEGGAAAG